MVELGEVGEAMRTVVRRGAAEAMLTAEARARADASIAIAAAMKEGTGGGALDDDMCGYGVLWRE